MAGHRRRLPRRLAWLLAEGAVKLGFAAVLALVLDVSDTIFLLVGGSDSTSTLLSPSGRAQAGLVAAAALCLMAPAGRRARLALWAPALLLSLLATHRLLLDRNHGEIRDCYALITVQALPFDPYREGPGTVRQAWGGFAIGPPGSDATLWVLSPPLVGLDRGPLAALAE